MYRTMAEREAQRGKESAGSRSKSGWFKCLGHDGTVVVPATVDSTLMSAVDKALKAAEAPRGYKLLVMEDGGRTVASEVVRANPFPRPNCNRSGCSMCVVGDSMGKCYKSNVVYSISCNRSPCCGGSEADQLQQPTPVPTTTTTYVGETSRPVYKRGLEHKDAYIKKKPTSFMWRHAQQQHDGVIGDPNRDFVFGVTSTHRLALNRILDEAVRIQEGDANPNVISLNSRHEYFAPQFVRPAFQKGPEDHYH